MEEKLKVAIEAGRRRMEEIENDMDKTTQGYALEQLMREYELVERALRLMEEACELIGCE